MRAALLLLIVACRSKPPATIENTSVPAHDKRASSSAVAEPSPSPSPPPSQPPPPSPPPRQPAPVASPALPCPQLPNGIRLGVSTSFLNHTTVVHDLCLTLDHALGKLATPLVAHAFLVEIVLVRVSVTGASSQAMITCQLALHVDVASGNLGATNGAAKVVTGAAPSHVSHGTTDCIEAVVQDTIVNKVGPLMAQHAAAVAAPRPPSPAPPPTP